MRKLEEKKLFCFLKRVIKSFSFATPILRDIIIIIRKSLRGAGYLKALERGNSVPRPNRFCEAKKVKFSAVLLQNPKMLRFTLNAYFIMS